MTVTSICFVIMTICAVPLVVQMIFDIRRSRRIEEARNSAQEACSRAATESHLAAVDASRAVAEARRAEAEVHRHELSQRQRKDEEGFE